MTDLVEMIDKVCNLHLLVVNLSLITITAGDKLVLMMVVVL